MHLRSFLFLASTAAAVFTISLGAAERVFDVTGVVRAPLKNGRVVISHEDIPGFMPAMTMGFTLSNPTEAVTLVVGDKVKFHFRVSETASSAADFVVLGRVDAPDGATPPVKSIPRVREGDPVPSFSLLDQDGRAFTTAQLSGRVTVLTFIFSRCPVPEYCPAMALRFSALQKVIRADPRLARSAHLLSITIDPEFDRPEILKAYGAAVGADPAYWQFATGEKAEVNTLTQAFSVFAQRNGVTLDHTLCTALIGRDGRVIELWRGNGWKIDEVIAALNRAATE